MMQLGFLEFEVSRLDAWHDFLTAVIGLQPADDAGRYRLDGRAWRIALREGPADDLACVGWSFDGAGLDACLDRLCAAGHLPTEAVPSARGVSRRLTCTDPSGMPLELVSPLPEAPTPFTSATTPHGFVADELGLGHLVLSAKDKATSVAFYTGMLGFELSDHIVTEVWGHPVDLSFFHANARHHSLALGGPQKRRLHHFMLQMRSLDDVGACLDRFLSGGHRIFQTLGRHPNDRMLSFYGRTPSGFQVEIGWGGRTITEGWEPTTYDHISEWGHHPPAMFAGERR